MMNLFRRKFNPDRANYEAIKPSKYDKELNKCTHPDVDEAGICRICDSVLNTDMELGELEIAASTLISYLESMKMQINKSCSSRKIKHEANKYFDMIPYLENITDLYEVCRSYAEAQEVEDAKYTKAAKDISSAFADIDDLDDDDELLGSPELIDETYVNAEDICYAYESKTMCNHKNSNNDLVRNVNDGSGDVYCEMCGARWNPVIQGEEKTLELTKELISNMENDKWIGKLSFDTIRECSSCISFLKKYPKIHADAVEEFIKRNTDTKTAKSYTEPDNSNNTTTDKDSNTGDE